MTYAEALICKGKREAAAVVQAECHKAVSYFYSSTHSNSSTAEQGQTSPSCSSHGKASCEECQHITPPNLASLLDILLSPHNPISDLESVEWCKALITGGDRSYDEFCEAVRKYDTTVMCGLVWTADFVAFRCRTCGISQCMSLCAECFKKGDHAGHDFNMFKSQAGGACDCGDSSVMKPSGFCSQHHGDNYDWASSSRAPHDLMCVAQCMIPRILLRLIQHLRVNSICSEDLKAVAPAAVLERFEKAIEEADSFLKMLHDLSSLGAAMRTVMTRILTNSAIYQKLCFHSTSSSSSSSVHMEIWNKDGQGGGLRVGEDGEDGNMSDDDQNMLTVNTTNTNASHAIHNNNPLSNPNSIEYTRFMESTQHKYLDALHSLTTPKPPEEFQHIPALVDKLTHKSFLEELVFWTVKYEFPERLVCLLLKLLPDSQYKEAFTTSFVLHYSRVSMMLVKSSNSDKLSNRVVHVSVQLFSNEELATLMTKKLSLLNIMVVSLKSMMCDVLIPTDYGLPGIIGQQPHMVVDCSKHVMRDHCYWPLVSDLNNVLSHSPIALQFMSDEVLLRMWFDFLKMFQGMNVNTRIAFGHHVDFEPNTYYASFSGELEASASPMWALVSHIHESSKNNDSLVGINREFTRNLISHCLNSILEWLKKINFNSETMDANRASFHIPLHRYYSVFLRQAVKYQSFSLSELLPPDHETLALLIEHPLRVQTAFYEIMCGLWVRNGLQIKGQAMTYIQCHFSKSMVDADLFLLQLCSTRLPPSRFLGFVLDRFQIRDWLKLAKGGVSHHPTRVYRDHEQEMQMVESTLIFLISLLSIRTNLSLSGESLARIEMISLLCMGDKTHSMLYEHMPEKCGTSVPLEVFGRVLTEVAEFSEPRFDPSSGNMQQGIYLLKPEVWEFEFDPIYVLLRAVHRREFHTCLERYANQFNGGEYRSRMINLKASKQGNEEEHKDILDEMKRKSEITSPWPPWRIPQDYSLLNTTTDSNFQDPRLFLMSRYCHGMIFNLLYQCVGPSNIAPSSSPDGSSTSATTPVVSSSLTSLVLHLLELTIDVDRKYREQQSLAGECQMVVAKRKTCKLNSESVSKSRSSRRNKASLSSSSKVLLADKRKRRHVVDSVYDTFYRSSDIRSNVCTTISYVYTSCSKDVDVFTSNCSGSPNHHMNNVISTNKEVALIRSIVETSTTSDSDSSTCCDSSVSCSESLSDEEMGDELFPIDQLAENSDKALSRRVKKVRKCGSGERRRGVRKCASGSNVSTAGPSTSAIHSVTAIIGSMSDVSDMESSGSEDPTVALPSSIRHLDSQEDVPSPRTLSSAHVSGQISTDMDISAFVPSSSSCTDSGNVINGGDENSNNNDVANSSSLVAAPRRHTMPQRRSGTNSPPLVDDGSQPPFSTPNYSQGQQTQNHYEKFEIGEHSIISLLLRLYEKFKSDDAPCYLLPSERSHSLSEGYKKSRVGDGCFFIGKALDSISEMGGVQVNAIRKAKIKLNLVEDGGSNVNSGTSSSSMTGAVGGMTCDEFGPSRTMESNITEGSITAGGVEISVSTDDNNSSMNVSNMSGLNSPTPVTTQQHLKKTKAKERQKQIMQEMAEQRARFMHENNMFQSTTTTSSAYSTHEEESKEVTAVVPNEQPPGDAHQMTDEDQTTSVTPSTEVDQSTQIGDKKKQDDMSSEEVKIKIEVEREEFTCCHCLLKGEIDVQRPIGLVALLQASSVVGHKHLDSSRLVLPSQSSVSDHGEVTTPSTIIADSLMTESVDQMKTLAKHFSPTSVLLNTNTGFHGGTHVQSCGHHMHFDCRSSYCQTLHQQTLDTEAGEFICPLCRQTANALIPLMPVTTAVMPDGSVDLRKKRVRVEDFDSVMEVLSCLRSWSSLESENEVVKSIPTPISTEINSCLNRLKSSNTPTNDFTPFNETSDDADALEIHKVTSIIRLQLEADLVQRGGFLLDLKSSPGVQETLTSSSPPKATVANNWSTPTVSPSSSVVTSPGTSSSSSSVSPSVVCKTKFCFYPLYRMLIFYLATTVKNIPRALVSYCQTLSSASPGMDFASTARRRDVPLCFSDVLAFTINLLVFGNSYRVRGDSEKQITGNVASKPSLKNFDKMVGQCFHIVCVEGCIKILTDEKEQSSSNDENTVDSAHSMVRVFQSVLGQLNDTLLLNSSVVKKAQSDAVGCPLASSSLIQIQNLALHFLRIATLLKHYIFEIDLPSPSNTNLSDESNEFELLSQYLNISHGSLDMDVCVALTQQVNEAFIEKTFAILPATESTTQQKSDELSFDLIFSSCLNRLYMKGSWAQPQLLILPHNYDDIFQYYHKRKCDFCGEVPKDCTVCLICGQIVCLKELCCRTLSSTGSSYIFETVRHAETCTGSTGIFLAVNSSTIVVVRGKRACIWGSVYLDIFGEEDKELKRGKPLYLHMQRYHLLQHQWLTHKFDHTSKKWILHRNGI